MDQTTYKMLKISGKIDVRRTILRSQPAYTILMMGVTGAGKSTFIEALAGNSNLQISSNTLASCTQTVTAYDVVNITSATLPIVLVDTPGTNDPTKSELEIVQQLTDWLAENGRWVNRILYFLPIKNVRLSGTNTRTMKTFKAITGVKSASNITVVTTLWDQVVDHDKAALTFNLLKTGPWKDLLSHGTKMERFYNTHQSALDILDTGVSMGTTDPCYFEGQKELTSRTLYIGDLVTDLRDRVDSLRTKEEGLQDDLSIAVQNNKNGDITSLQTQLFDVRRDLQKFKLQLAGLDAIFSHSDTNQSQQPRAAIAPPPTTPGATLLYTSPPTSTAPIIQPEPLRPETSPSSTPSRLPSLRTPTPSILSRIKHLGTKVLRLGENRNR